MPASITEPALAFRRKDGSNKWWTETEEKILVNRLLRDDPSKGDLNNRAGISFEGILGAITDVDLWPIYLVRPGSRCSCFILPPCWFTNDHDSLA